MNISTNRKCLVLLLLFGLAFSLLAAVDFTRAEAADSPKLNMHLDYNRFLDQDDQSILFIDYQIPYRSLLFLAHSRAYFAEVDVRIQVANRDSVILTQSVTDNIGISSKHDASSEIKSYLNRISFLLEEDYYQITFTAEDINSQKVFDWQFETGRLPTDALLSDLELNSRVYADSSAYLAKFRRQGSVYEPIPSILLRRNYHEYAHIYVEIYTAMEGLAESQMINLSLEQAGDLVMDEYLDMVRQKSHESLSLKIPLADLKAGKYQGRLALQAGERLEHRDFEFVLSEEIETQLSLFNHPDEEYSLMRYFMASRAHANWEALDYEEKRRMITNFWHSMALSTRMSEADIMDLIHERIEHANRFYSHLKPGWATDRGRVYIRNGAPDDIEKGSSSDEGRFVRKDYQIWKYHSGDRPVYIFIDIQMNNNYRLIYVSGDDMELSNPDWMRYLGGDFDMSLLRN